MPTKKKAVSRETIFSELNKSTIGKSKNSVEGELGKLLDTIKETAKGHLSRVKGFLPEFDDHSIEHSDAVLDYVARIIGEKGIKTLSVYELFILSASAYLHDFGMALTDYEKKVLELAEEEPLPVAIDGIDECKNMLKSSFDHRFEDALKINYLSHKERKLIESLAQLYQEYQTYRNGYTEQYKKLMEDCDEENRQEKLDKLYANIRMNFIRETHPKRSAQYAENWGSRYEEENSYVSGIMNDVAKVVQSHGEPFDYVKKLGTEVSYAAIDNDDDSDKANLQFASMMLRLGDIVHFTLDRAPVSLRREIIFDSDYSKEQWMQKFGVTNKVTKTTEQTKIVFNASCPSPRSYCYLKKYIGYINQEVDGFNSFKKGWKDRYQIPLVPVEDKVKPLNDAFETNPDLKFTLNQNKIIELLMGTQLYRDPYACLRELYQNALDACRCTIARRKSTGEDNPKCAIEFGVKEDEELKGSKYLYCLDNGKGMSKHIIEHYFLNIGSSYYKSKDFYSEWAKCGFTPTSQFGIGILSCFMIGERLEVLTKEHNGKLIAFGVDGPQETFYYWKDDKHISLSDKETIEKQGSGTLVKVYLKQQYANGIDDGELDKLELLKCFGSERVMPFGLYSSDFTNEDEIKYINLFNRWWGHFYKKIFDFVQLPFPEIAVQVRCADALLPIEPRPHLANVDLAAFEKDKRYYEKHIWNYWRKNSHLVGYPIDISHSNYHYHSMLVLPTKEKEDYGYIEYACARLCVDGVSIGSGNDLVVEKFRASFSGLASCGIINFVGEHKPALKIDRCSFVNKVYIENPEQLISDYLDEVIRISKEHIERFRIRTGSRRYQKIWDWAIWHLPRYLETLLTNHFDKKGYPQICSTALSEFMGETGTVPELMFRESVKVPRDKITYRNDAFLIKKLSSAQSATFTPDGKLQLAFGELPQLPYFETFVDVYVVGLPEDTGPYQDYDILPAFYPLVSHRLAKVLRKNLTLESGSYVGAFDSITRTFYEGWYHFSKRVQMFRYLNKKISVFQYNHSGYFAHLAEQVSEGLSYVTLYDDGQERGREYTIIILINSDKDHFLVVEGKLTRKEMDEIVRYCKKKKTLE